MSFQKVINKYRTYSGSQREKGDLFEKLMVNFLRTYQVFDSKFRNVWQWTDFPYKSSISVHDVGIDLVALTADGEFIAVQCKCYKEDAYVDKAALDSFIASSGRWLTVQEGKKVKFASRLLISTSNKWSKEAESSTRNQDPPFSRISLTDLEEAQVNWEAMDRGESGPQARIPQHEPKEHQKEAIEAFHRHFKTADRGRLILPCGTGKTFTALRIAERETGGKGLVVFMAPSIALVGQTLKEWAAQAKARLSPVCVCSDAQISTRKYSSHEDPLDVSSESLPTKATTSPKEIADRLEKAKTAHPGDLRVVFSTYQSAGAVSEAIGLLKERIDLLVCDEAHRTTGQIEAEKGESQFVKVHDQKVLPADKRLYMTATPRIYSEPAKRSAAENSILVCSMDDPDVYGEEVYRMGFGDAVRNGLLSDYKVLLLTIGLRKIPPELSRQVADGKTEIDATDAIKLIGCIHALSKRMDVQSGVLKDVDPEVMHKAVAFCAKIKDSKSITDLFNGYRKTYLKGLPPAEREELVAVAADHIDGTMGASTRDDMMSWLKNADRDSNDCRILSNCRCLSTGVDVPSLDAVLFLSAKNSEIEVVQSVGRVMRLAPGKKFGYVIIPIVVHPDVSPEKALSDNAAYKVVWEVLNALKSHDDRFNAKINQIRFNETKPEDGGSILIGGPSGGGGGDGNDESEPEAPAGFKRSDIFAPLLDLDGYRDAIYAKLVRKVGTRSDLLNWAGEVGHIARIYAERIRIVTEAPGRHRDEFGSFLKNLQENLNPSV
ncbi:MAG: DEAD/DEAH box helicase family protein, partial [Deltaproteobacteria bacterium]|nr:DEAD/DEAH box helicase family protein [Deltaproteobacteria bacterium]